MRIWIWLLALVAGIAVGAGVVWLLREAPADAVSPPLAQPPPQEPPSPAAAPPAATAPRFEIDPDRRAFAQPNGPDAPGAMPEVIDYPLAEKYTAEVLSGVPHRIIGAWDDAPGRDTPGPRRAFIAVVDPDLTDVQLEDLVRDTLARHRDADFLRLRVFDSEEAARRPSWTDGGAAVQEHLIAEIRRNASAGTEAIQVRGRPLEP